MRGRLAEVVMPRDSQLPGWRRPSMAAGSKSAAKSLIAPRRIDRTVYSSDNIPSQRMVWGTDAPPLQAVIRLLCRCNLETTRGSEYGIRSSDLLYGLFHGASRAWTCTRGAWLRVTLGPRALAYPAVAPVGVSAG